TARALLWRSSGRKNLRQLWAQWLEALRLDSSERSLQKQRQEETKKERQLKAAAAARLLADSAGTFGSLVLQSWQAAIRQGRKQERLHLAAAVLVQGLDRGTLLRLVLGTWHHKAMHAWQARTSKSSAREGSRKLAAGLLSLLDNDDTVPLLLLRMAWQASRPERVRSASKRDFAPSWTRHEGKRSPVCRKGGNWKLRALAVPSRFWGSSCYFSHEWRREQNDRCEELEEVEVEEENDGKLAAVVFHLQAEGVLEVMPKPSWASWAEGSTGPMRVRVVGNLEELGQEESGNWDPNLGIDLIWEGDGWKSFLVPAPPCKELRFCLVRVDQSESHPGLLQGWRRWEMHEARQFTWSAEHVVYAPARGVLEIFLTAQHCRPSASSSRTGSSVPTAWRWREDRYLPPSFDFSERWPLVLFLHSMHGRLEGDNNLFFESDTPVRLLDEPELCPAALKDRCVLLTPQCPIDKERGDGAGIWLRKGWYEDSVHDPKVEASLLGLVDTIRDRYNLDPSRLGLCGSSMGAYGALELAARNP
ncbi:unnamed protein product, partial [Effrenium voratum]